MTTPRITPTLTPITERHAVDAILERSAGGISEREAFADVAAHLQLDSDAQMRVQVAASVGISARESKVATPIGLVAGEGLAGAIAAVGRFVELARAAKILAPEQIRTADEAGIMLQQLLANIVDAIDAEAVIPPGAMSLDEVFRKRGDDAAAMQVGRIYMRMTTSLLRAKREKDDAADLEAAFGLDAAFGGKAGA